LATKTEANEQKGGGEELFQNLLSHLKPINHDSTMTQEEEKPSNEETSERSTTSASLTTKKEETDWVVVEGTSNMYRGLELEQKETAICSVDCQMVRRTSLVYNVLILS